MDVIDSEQNQVAEFEAKQEQEWASYCEKMNSLADSFMDTRFKINEMMVNTLLEYYSFTQKSLEPWVLCDLALKPYHEGGTTGLFNELVDISNWLQMDCYRLKTLKVRDPLM